MVLAPRGAGDEIRLLELSDHLTSSSPEVGAIDFGLDVEGVRFRLSIADISGEQLEQIKRHPSRLPPGWSLDRKKIWRRGA